MTTSRIRKTVRMTPEQASLLEQRAKELGISQSAVVRMELAAYMAKFPLQESSKIAEAR